MLIDKPLRRLKKLNTYDCLWPYVLKILDEKPTHAYTLRQEIKKRFNFLPGTVTAYTTLYSLYLNGFVKKEIKGRRTIYEITEEGKQELKKAAKFYRETFKKLK